MAMTYVGWLYMLWWSSHGSIISTFMGLQVIRLFNIIQYWDVPYKKNSNKICLYLFSCRNDWFKIDNWDRIPPIIGLWHLLLWPIVIPLDNVILLTHAIFEPTSSCSKLGLWNQCVFMNMTMGWKIWYQYFTSSLPITSIYFC